MASSKLNPRIATKLYVMNKNVTMADDQSSVLPSSAPSASMLCTSSAPQPMPSQPAAIAKAEVDNAPAGLRDPTAAIR